MHIGVSDSSATRRVGCTLQPSSPTYPAQVSYSSALLVVPLQLGWLIYEAVKEGCGDDCLVTALERPDRLMLFVSYLIAAPLCLLCGSVAARAQSALISYVSEESGELARRAAGWSAWRATLGFVLFNVLSPGFALQAPPPRHPLFCTRLSGTPFPPPHPHPYAQGFYGRSVVWSGVRYQKRHGCVHSLEQLRPTSRNSLRGADRSRTMWSEPAEWLERVVEVAASASASASASVSLSLVKVSNVLEDAKVTSAAMQAAAKGVVECSFSKSSTTRSMAGPPVAAAAGAAAGRPPPRVDSSPTRAESLVAGCSRDALEALVLHSLEAGTPVTLERLEPLQEPEAEGADDAAGAIPSLLRSRQTIPPPDAPPPDAPHEPELAPAVVDRRTAVINMHGRY